MLDPNSCLSCGRHLWQSWGALRCNFYSLAFEAPHKAAPWLVLCIARAMAMMITAHLVGSSSTYSS